MDITKLALMLMEQVRGFVQPAIDVLITRMAALEDRFKNLPAPKDGIDGKDGVSVTVSDVMPEIERTISVAIEAIPKPENGKDADPEVIRNMVALAVDQIPRPADGKDGTDGKDGADGKGVDVNEVLASLEVNLKQLVSDLPKPENGKDGERGEKGEKGETGQDGKSVDVQEAADILLPKLREIVESWPKAEKGDKGEDGASVTADEVLPELKAEIQRLLDAWPRPADGEKGADGKDGASVTVNDVLPDLFDKIEETLKTWPQPKDGEKGQDGADGKDGKSFDPESVRSIMETMMANWALDFERRAQGVLERAIAAMPRPKDGVDGKDGRDGMGFEDQTLEYDGERTLTFKMARGDLIKTHAFRFPFTIFRDVFIAGKGYEEGDIVSHAGSMWHCDTPTTDRPGEPGSRGWTLCVKKGAQGADAFQVAKRNGFEGSESDWLDKIYEGRSKRPVVKLPIKD